ncbi:Metallo-hydrolase/oxidoreductase [Parathielavia appendiculata]|uniref:Metallo-hydrolase/oxidoreductase n=1 Tax=Parathielavia appendiculata TaxID=2587402 RepID=A0AAN6U0G4_9PEZI|nr:Metallo-hydrolase/oxidoreductase [Parathielavia appendiculata]
MRQSPACLFLRQPLRASSITTVTYRVINPIKHQEHCTSTILPKPPFKMSTTQQQQPQQPLPSLPEITRLTSSCIRILAGNPGPFTLQGTNTYLLGTGPSRILIDTGESKPSWAAALRCVLAEEGEGTTVSIALLTHWHRDHTDGVRDLLSVCPGARVLKHQGGKGDVQVEELQDGQRFEVAGASVTAVHTPGHTADHTVFVWEEEGALFTGDNVLGHGTSVFEDLGLYVGSLERMGKLYDRDRGGKAYPGHGAVVPDGPGKIAEYIRHRAQREEQVVQALRSFASLFGSSSPASAAGIETGSEPAKDDRTSGDAWTVMELVRTIYRDVPESLHPAAARGVVQILQKLQREGKVVDVDDGERWKLASTVGSGRSAL